MKSIVACLSLAAAIHMPAAASFAEAEHGADAPSIGLALGSGGAGGLAHIAMLQVFDDLGIKPERIAGTSIGAIIGALYAAGLDAKQIHAIFDEFGGSNLDMLSGLLEAGEGSDLTGLLELDLGQGGVLDSTRFMDFLASKIDASDFSELAIPLEVVATDYWTGEMVVLKEGDLFHALAASSAVPGLFPPVRQGDQLLIDGGTSNPLPSDLLVGRHDLVVAIDVSGAIERQDGNDVPLLDLLFNTFGLMQQSLIDARMANNGPDIYIKPAITGVRLLHFNKIDKIIEASQLGSDTLRRELESRLEAD